MRRTLVLLLALALSALATTSRADPRWWWDDTPVAVTPGDARDPHLFVTPPNLIGGGGGDVFVTWSEPDSTNDHEIWLTASFDNGCSFCPPVAITDNAIDDRRPRIAVAPVGVFLSVQVIFESGNDVAVAHDASTLSDLVPNTCTELAALSAAITGGNQFVQLNPPGSQANRPDLDVGFNGLFTHFHAVWRDDSTGEDDIFHARDLFGLGGPEWTMTPPKNLTASNPPGPMAVQPAVAVDWLTDPDPSGGGNTMDRSAVNVVFVDVMANRIVGLRSVDSGATFSPDGSRMDLPPGPVSDPPVDLVAQPALATAANPFSFTDPAWACTAWNDLRTGPIGAIYADARQFDTPATPNPDWASPDTQVAAPTGGGRDATITALPGITAPSPVWIGYVDDTLSAPEVFYRAGLLQDLPPNQVDLITFPIAPVRPLDPTFSADGILTHCTHDDGTFLCDADRVLGDASGPEFATDGLDVYAVWSDSRSGTRDIFFKRTDQVATGTSSTLTTGCTNATTAYLDVTFAVPDTCPAPFVNERMARYLVYYGEMPGGPYANAGMPLELEHDPTLGASATVRIDGLLPGTQYHVIVVAEDEARNLSPFPFDPFVNNAGLLQEQTMVTPADCRPDVNVSCFILGEACRSDPTLGSNGVFDFGELIELELTFENAGTAPAVNYTALLQATGATVIDPPLGAITLPLIPENFGQRRLIVTAKLPRPSQGANCGDPIDFDVINQMADGPIAFPDRFLPGCDATLGPLPCGECQPAPEIRVTECSLVVDTCTGSGMGNRNGVIDPAEYVMLAVEFTNIGDAPADGFTARMTAEPDLAIVRSGGTVTGPPLLSPGQSFLHAIEVEVLANCGDPLQLAIVDQESDAGLFQFDDDTTSCQPRVGRETGRSQNRYEDLVPFFVPNGGSGTSTVGVDPTEPRRVDRVELTIGGNFPDPANLEATLVGPSGNPLDVTVALFTTLDITDAYNTSSPTTGLGGPGHYELTLRELMPDIFDPSVDGWALAIEDAAATCDACTQANAPEVVVAGCSITGDRCPSDPTRDGDGRREPGETVEISVDLRNDGSVDSTNYVATLVATGATIVDPPGGMVAIPIIPAGDMVSLPVMLELPLLTAGASCGDPVDVALRNASDDWPATHPDDELTSCDFAISDPCTDCAPAAQVCLYRSDVTNVSPHVPPHGTVYLASRTAEDIALQGGPYQCPFMSGDLEPDTNALFNGVNLVLYQVNLPVNTLRLSKSGATIQFVF